MRSRNLKPGFFKNEQLAEMPVEARLLFAGLWCMADREGRLLDRPKRIKIELFPADTFEVEPLLARLADAGLILRYEMYGEHYIQVVNFGKHQHPHKTEAASVIPAPLSNGALTVQEPNVNGIRPADSLLLIPDSLIPDSSSLRSDGGSVEKPNDGANGRGRGTRIPEPFPISADMRAWAAEKCPHVEDVDGATEEFVDYWRGIAGRHGVKLDWVGTWRNRLRQLEGYASRRGPGRPAKPAITWRPEMGGDELA